MSSSSLALQKAIYVALTADATLMAMVGVGGQAGVYDYVPEQAQTAFPYVTIGDSTARDWNTNDFYGKNATVTIHAWSRQQGRTECKTIQGHIQRILQSAINPLVVAEANVVIFQLEFEDTMIDPASDAVTHHGVQRFRALIQEGG